jgi:hypothetical protein
MRQEDNLLQSGQAASAVLMSEPVGQAASVGLMMSEPISV